MWRISYYADVEGDWTTSPLNGDYPTEDAARAAWAEAYRGEDELGNSAYPRFWEEEEPESISEQKGTP